MRSGPLSSSAIKACSVEVAARRPVVRWVAAVVLAAAGTCSPARADLAVRLAVDTHVEPDAAGGRAPADRRVVWTVTLAPQRLTVASASDVADFDFVARKRVVFDTVAQTRVEYSLYDTVGFRSAELRNRIGLSRALESAKVTGGVQRLVEQENVLAIQEQPSSPLQVVDEGAERVFAADSRVFGRVALAGTAVSPDEARLFSQFLRYEVGGHPQILATLAASRVIPSKLVLTRHEFGSITQTLVLESVETTQAAPVDPTRFALRAAGVSADPLDQLLDRAAGLGPDDWRAARQRTADDFAASLRDGKVFEAYLSLVEGTLMSGDPLSPLTAEQRERLQSDAAARQLGAALAATNRPALEEAVRSLQELKTAAASKAYILDIFEANDRALLGDRRSAKALFVACLAAHPTLAAVYKDLGDVLFLDFDMPRAWRSWDAGRRIAPQFVNFEAVTRFEQSLVRDHPEFF